MPLTPIVVALAVRLGWDAVTGLGMSLLAVGCGFASGVCNPFTVGVAQSLAGLPMFSGVWLRGVGFILIYALLMENSFAIAAFWAGGFVNAWPGIVLQLVLIPPTIMLIERIHPNKRRDHRL